MYLHSSTRGSRREAPRLCAMTQLFIAVLVSVELFGNARAEQFTLVADGQPRAAIVLSGEAWRAEPTQPTIRRRKVPANPLGDERLAAEELQAHIREMSGAELPIVEAGQIPAGHLPVRIGSAVDSDRKALPLDKDANASSFAILVDAERIVIHGASPEGALFGTYELLEQLGVRWYLPGDLGKVVPQVNSIVVPEQQTRQSPSFPARRLQAVGAPQWERRLRLAGPYFPASHGAPGFSGRQGEKLFELHPEYFSLIDGERKRRQLCVSNPEVVKIATEATRAFFRQNPQADIMGIGANDGRGFCECENCYALDGGDYDPFGHSPSMTDRYVWFFNQVLQGIENEFPNKRLGFYAYSVYNRPPVKVTPSPKLVPAVALITLCRLHGMGNPVCPEKSYEEWIIRQWGELVPEVYYRGYFFNLADPGLPFFMVERIRREVPLGKRLGIAGWRVEAPYEWAGSTPSRYVAAKLMWDHTVEVDQLMADFYEKFFGPAKGSMRRYVETMSRALDEADFHTGSSWDMPHVYTAEVRREAREAIEEGAASTRFDSVYARRVAMYAQSLDYLENFVEMLESRAVHQYEASHNAMSRMITIRETLRQHDPPLIGKHAANYLERFFAKTTTQGYERTSSGNRFLAGLDDTWLFQIDPEQVGEDIGWWRPETTGGNWQSLKTSTSSWSNQGLRYYKGLAWYRQTVRLPEDCKEKRIFLWCGGIDELAKVWVNGKELGISPRASFSPFEMDATTAVRAGQPNTIVFCVNNATLNEVGTGGITGPVMFYEPADGRNAVIRNAKPPHAVFPEY